MNAVNFLKNLKSRGFVFNIDGANVHCRGTKEPLTPEILKKLKRHKPEILKVLSKNTDQLTDTDRQAYKGWFEVMTGEKFNMSSEKAHKKAWSLLQKTTALLAKEDFKRDGYVKIYSADLGRHIYLCKNKSTRTPDKNIPVFRMDEIKDFSTLSREDALLLAKAKTIFNPMAIFQDE